MRSSIKSVASALCPGLLCLWLILTGCCAADVLSADYDAIELPRSDWIKSFDGKSLSAPIQSRWAVKKQNGDFDQFTGATITPQSVVNEVRNTLLFFEKVKDQLFDS